MYGLNARLSTRIACLSKSTDIYGNIKLDFYDSLKNIKCRLIYYIIIVFSYYVQVKNFNTG